MNRDKILLEFLRSDVYEAAIRKRNFHEGQITYWKDRKAALESVTHVTVKPRDIVECDKFTDGHEKLFNEFKAWVEFLSKATEIHMKLDYDDYAFFFG